ncbi:MAG: LON peptidase substrate-binding domain-containing protein [Aestuariivirga sp.]|uniref:LON peptidase substrate-binding domain-containing protein n=1 Tax=Aestuariivirga sp. TaxID=2650926 RepID=UPI0025C3A1F2|nr:LON peptidase substrate-binding domain-containing protein [Aestuariivirga sp.]MCA3561706.1 LON peptidase substrate-binding domain-containing protein [Aestuariivirga sp.]
MGIFDRYRGPQELPQRIPVFPLAGALLLPRADLPLNIFEPRYLAMIEHALANDKLIGIIQPAAAEAAGDVPPLMKVGCVGRITSWAETPDDRMLITLTGVARFQIVDELDAGTPFRQVIADYHPFAADLAMGAGAAEVNRPALLKVFRDYLDANNMSADWQEVDQAPTEVLVNTLSLLAPYPPQEKQALLEAPDLRTRADVLVALTEVALSKMGKGAKPRLQ